MATTILPKVCRYCGEEFNRTAYPCGTLESNSEYSKRIFCSTDCYFASKSKPDHPGICTIGGCEDDVYAKGYCQKHYSANRKYGDPLIVSTVKNQFNCPRVETLEDLLSRCEPGVGGCLEYTGAKTKTGYGTIVRNGHRTTTHRLAMMLAGHEVKKGLHVCHKCDNPKCCNPDHLFIATPKENTLDMLAKKRMPRGWRSVDSWLTQERVNEIKDAARKSSMDSVARMFGISRDTVKRCVRGLRDESKLPQPRSLSTDPQ